MFKELIIVGLTRLTYLWFFSRFVIPAPVFTGVSLSPDRSRGQALMEMGAPAGIYCIKYHDLDSRFHGNDSKRVSPKFIEN